MEVNNGAKDRIYTYISFREGMCSESWTTPANLKLERKIGFAPISHSGKECVLKVELLPHNNLEAATGFEPVIKVLQTSALPLGYAANNWASWIRTSAWRSQSPLPYRLAIAH